MLPESTKRCSLCSVEKPTSDFHRDKSRRDGFRNRCKACITSYNRGWYEANKDEIIAKQMAAYRADPERKITYSREWYQRTHPERLAQRAEYRAAHREEIQAAYERLKVEGYFSDKVRRWRKENPAAYKAQKQRSEMIRRARKRETQIEPIDTATILARDRSMCGICGKLVDRKDLSFDHIIPLSRGGAHAAWNLQVAHWRCNTLRNAGRTPGQPRLPL